MELRHLRYFIHVAEELHFGRAAARLGMSQPPLSQQIRLLEDELGVALLERTSRRVTLTPAGQLFLLEAQKAVAQVARAISVARSAGLGELGEVVVGFAASVPFTAMVAQALAAFRESHPRVQLNLTEMSTKAQLDALYAGTIELGFVRDIDPLTMTMAFDASLLMTEPLVVAMPANHPLVDASADPTTADLRDAEFILYRNDFASGFNSLFKQLCSRAGYVPKVVQEVTGPFTLLGLVSAGLGITIVTPTLGSLHPENIVFRPLSDPEAFSRLWMLRRQGISTAALHLSELVLARR
ncbi:LysR substrate-binding domain-containing protein [Sphingomonas endolithica]|uniref:LysR substrate-binding domain-containing protein n=1 Tax=Sphingomonas endolithica TaxID=2972485 RepID=UPI0021AF8131|nr:LysR substrate-binding domain-containing protein [Sphingomonas sp. ZFBP2030]